MMRVGYAYREREIKGLPRWFLVSQAVLRILTVLCTAASIIVMVKSGTSISVNGLFTLTARYYYSSAFKYLMGVNVTVSAMALLSLGAVYGTYKKKSYHTLLYSLFLYDLVVMLLLISACGAATAIGIVAMYGQKKTFWFKICDTAEKFCVHVGVSVVLSYVASVCLFVLTILSSYKLMKSAAQPQDSDGINSDRIPT